MSRHALFADFRVCTTHLRVLGACAASCPGEPAPNAINRLHWPNHLFCSVAGPFCSRRAAERWIVRYEAARAEAEAEEELEAALTGEQ